MRDVGGLYSGINLEWRVKVDDIEFKSFQVEVIKLNGSETIELLISRVRGARGRRKLIGEATVGDCYNPIISFQVLHAQDMDDLRDRFMRQLVWRGYKPLRWRPRVEGKFLDWRPIDPGKYDIAAMEKVSGAAAEMSE